MRSAAENRRLYVCSRSVRNWWSRPTCSGLITTPLNMRSSASLYSSDRVGSSRPQYPSCRHRLTSDSSFMWSPAEHMPCHAGPAYLNCCDLKDNIWLFICEFNCLYKYCRYWNTTHVLLHGCVYWCSIICVYFWCEAFTLYWMYSNCCNLWQCIPSWGL